MLVTNLKESLKVVLERTNKGSSMMSKQFGAEVTKGLEKVFVDFKYKESNISGGSKKSLSESTSVAQREIASCIKIMSNRLASVREASYVKPSA